MGMDTRSRMVALFGLLLMVLLGAPAAAQDPAFAGKTVRIVVPGPPGGPAGVIAHLLANKASIHLGTTVIVEYKPGAGGNIAIEYVARSAPDGTTLFFGVPALVTNPYFQKHALDPSVLAPVIQLNRGPFLLLVNIRSDIKSVADLVARIRAAPGQVGCNSGAVALSTVSCHLLQAHAGPMLMVAYPGNAQALAALDRGEIVSAFDFISSSAGAVKEGRLRAIAITSKDRNTGDFKDVPPIGETIPRFNLVGWQGIMVARDTPRALLLKLNAAFNKVLDEDEVQAFMRKGNLERAGGAPEAFADQIRYDVEFYGRVAREAKIEPQ